MGCSSACLFGADVFQVEQLVQASQCSPTSFKYLGQWKHSFTLPCVLPAPRWPSNAPLCSFCTICLYFPNTTSLRVVAVPSTLLYTCQRRPSFTLSWFHSCLLEVVERYCSVLLGTVACDSCPHCWQGILESATALRWQWPALWAMSKSNSCNCFSHLVSCRSWFLKFVSQARDSWSVWTTKCRPKRYTLNCCRKVTTASNSLLVTQ